MSRQPENGQPPAPQDPPVPGDAAAPPVRAEPGPDDVPAVAVRPDQQREARVVMTDGSVRTGLLIERTVDMVILKINNIRTPCPIKDIAGIEMLPTNRERYEQYQKALDPKDTRNRLNLAAWLQSVDMLPEALDQIETVLTLDPGNVKAEDLARLIREQIKLQKNAGKGVENAPEAKPAEARNKPPVFPLLSPEQINLIRVYEVNLADPPRMTVTRDAITRMMERFAGDPLIPANREGREAMYRKRPEQILELKFKLRDRDGYGDVKILEDPLAMKLFRDDVHRGWLINYCATSDCHGGTEAGRLWLYNRHPNSDATAYTNYLILDRFRARAPKGDHKGEPVPLIDYANPAQSPLLQLALPPADSLFPHPAPERAGKSGYRPLMRSAEDARFQRAVAWMQSMYIPRPDYGRIDYRSPEPPQAVAQQPPKPADGGEAANQDR